jgi:GWxTD domain-containing protein
VAKSILRISIVSILMILSIWGCAEQAQKQVNDLTLPDFSFVGLSEPMQDRENIRLSVHVKIPYTELQFTRDGSIFLARYEVSVNISDDSKERIAGKIWSDSLKMPSYQDTRKTNQTALSIESFLVPVGDINISVRVTDLYTKKSRVLNDNINQTEMYQGELALGNIMIIDNYSASGDELLMNESFYEVIDTLNFKAKLIGVKHPYTLTYELISKEESRKKVTEVLDHAGAIDSLLFFEIPLTDMQYTNYTLYLSAEDASGNRVMTKTHFRVRIKGINYDIGDIDEAVSQLRYLASERDIREISSGGGEQTMSKFNDFWSGLDPTPGTPENELMEEYYRRVAYTLEAFTVVQDGWKSDRGMIYILFGPPDEIQRGPFEIDQKPYQIWEYFRLGKQFVFRDNSGFGEYRLDYSYIDDNDWRFNY